MTARCGRGWWAWAMPSDAAPCRRPRVLAFPRVGFARTCPRGAHYYIGPLTPDVAGQYAAWIEWRETAADATPARDGSRSAGKPGALTRWERAQMLRSRPCQ